MNARIKFPRYHTIGFAATAAYQVYVSGTALIDHVFISILRSCLGIRI